MPFVILFVPCICCAQEIRASPSSAIPVYYTVTHKPGWLCLICKSKQSQSSSLVYKRLSIVACTEADCQSTHRFDFSKGRINAPHVTLVVACCELQCDRCEACVAWPSPPGQSFYMTSRGATICYECNKGNVGVTPLLPSPYTDDSSVSQTIKIV